MTGLSFSLITIGLIAIGLGLIALIGLVILSIAQYVPGEHHD